MNTALWILTVFLAVAFLIGGAAQAVLAKDKYRSLASSQHWVDDFSAGHLKAIGVIKMTGALGLVVPVWTGIAPVLVPLAACGMALFMAGAATTRFRRSEWLSMAGDIVFIGLFAFVAWGRFALEPFW